MVQETGIGNGFWVNAQDVTETNIPGHYVLGLLLWLVDSGIELQPDDTMWSPGEPDGGNGDCVKLVINADDSCSNCGLAMENCSTEQYALCKI